MPRPPGRPTHGVDAVLARWLASSWVKPCFCADETLDGAEGRYAPLPVLPRARASRSALRDRGIERLYAHQARAIDARPRPARHVVVATPTASGKSLCFHLPVLAGAGSTTPTRAPSTSSRRRRSRATRRRACAS